MRKQTYIVDEAERSRWAVDDDPPLFTADREYFQRVMRLGCAREDKVAVR